ncbi:MAG: hypothetical protein SWK76_09255 [Actinomycetota bacterium]|nr:hypothetical protein [Actinomycetota bacterium]
MLKFVGLTAVLAEMEPPLKGILGRLHPPFGFSPERVEGIHRLVERMAAGEVGKGEVTPQ